MNTGRGTADQENPIIVRAVFQGHEDGATFPQHDDGAVSGEDDSQASSEETTVRYHRPYGSRCLGCEAFRNNLTLSNKAIG